ncbi:Hydroxyneurosporene desaturase [Burkholderiales bacterium 8X]|nr:Hydroxyneurosporene desaturase [Burkholderiales bacterium 8X]
MDNPPVVIVGAGVGGLSAAVGLAASGIPVLVLERAAAPGGKMRQVKVGPSLMDAGPTVFTMRWVFDELLAQAGVRLEDRLVLRPADVLARHGWDDGSRLDLYADIDRSAEAIEAVFGSADRRGFLRLCTRAAQVYAALEKPFLRDTRPTPFSLVARAGLRGLPGLGRLSPFNTLWKELGHYFTDPRLRQLFGRYATYCGSSPFLATATLMLVAHVEQQGVWLVDGGMHRLAAMLEELATERGAQFRYGAHVDELVVRDGRVAGVRLASGERIRASAVVFNGDTGALARGLLGADAAVQHRIAGSPSRSLSALTFNLLADTSGFPLSRHNVFFSNDYAREFDDIFKRDRFPGDPTVYVCAQDRSDTDTAPPAGAERLLCIVNAPPSGDRRTFTSSEIHRCESRTFQLMARCGLQVKTRIEDTVVTTPNDFERMFPGTGGALYGPASHGWMASFSRPGSRSRLPGLYLAGGSTHPGPGVPMAALSGRLAAASILEDRASTRTSRPVAMHGGTSMR